MRYILPALLAPLAALGCSQPAQAPAPENEVATNETTAANQSGEAAAPATPGSAPATSAPAAGQPPPQPIGAPPPANTSDEAVPALEQDYTKQSPPPG